MAVSEGIRTISSLLLGCSCTIRPFFTYCPIHDQSLWLDPGDDGLAGPSLRRYHQFDAALNAIAYGVQWMCDTSLAAGSAAPCPCSCKDDAVRIAREALGHEEAQP